MKLHKNHSGYLPSIGYWGERSEVPIRVDFGKFQPGETSNEESRHYHKTRTTYFCILSGSMVVEVDGKEMVITSEAMLEIPPMSIYKVSEIGKDGCSFVVIGDHNKEDKVIC